MGEVELAALLCAFLSGSVAETPQYFDVNGLRRHVRVDCETETHVIEVGLDGKPSSRDSLHQALFFAHLTGKTPAVLLIDRDGFEGRYEYEMRQVTGATGVLYLRCSADLINRWATTAPMRDGYYRGADDLPRNSHARTLCDLRPLAGGAAGS